MQLYDSCLLKRTRIKIFSQGRDSSLIVGNETEVKILSEIKLPLDYCRNYYFLPSILRKTYMLIALIFQRDCNQFFLNPLNYASNRVIYNVDHIMDIPCKVLSYKKYLLLIIVDNPIFSFYVRGLSQTALTRFLLFLTTYLPAFTFSTV